MASSQEELSGKQDALSGIITDAYKHRASLLNILLGSSNLDELVSNIYYANKVSDMQCEAIADVRVLQQELEEQAQPDAASQPSAAPAAPDSSSDDLYVGVFYTSDYDFTDTVYASSDGNTFYRVATARPPMTACRSTSSA